MNKLMCYLKSNWSTDNRGLDSKVPLYFQLYSVLKASILDGTIPYDSKMPTEQELVKAFDVSRITAKRAMDELANDNLIVRSRGIGSHVKYKYRQRPVRAPLVGVLEDLIEMSKNSTVKVLASGSIAPPDDIKQLLELEPKMTVQKLIRVRSNIDGEPFAYYVSWTAGIKKGFTKRKLESTPRLKIIQENGIKLTRVNQVLGAENASTQVAKELDVKPGTALLSIRRESYDDNDQIVDVLDCLYNPKRFHYTMELTLEQE